MRGVERRGEQDREYAMESEWRWEESGVWQRMTEHVRCTPARNPRLTQL